MHKLSAEYLPCIMAEDWKNVKFAAWFILMELENYLVALLNVIITSKDYQKQSLILNFVDNID